MVEATSSASPLAYEALRAGAGVIDRADRGQLVVAGRDRASYLQGLLTNDVAALTAGRGCYAAYLTPQGRMIADLWVYELGDLILLSVPLAVKDAVLARLDQFVFTEDVQLGDVSATFAALVVAGPAAAATAAGVLAVEPAALAALPDHGNLRTRFQDQDAIVLRVTDTGEPGFELLVPAGHDAALRSALLARGAVAVDAGTADVLRVEAGVPKFGRDMDEDTIPLEAGLERTAISQTKGCYVGQEVIVRILHRGHGRVVRRLTGLALTGDAVPAAGAAVTADGREVGRVTSAVWSPALRRPVALAYLHRDFVAPGAAVAVAGAEATVVELPFVRRPG